MRCWRRARSSETQDDTYEQDAPYLDASYDREDVRRVLAGLADGTLIDYGRRGGQPWLL